MSLDKSTIIIQDNLADYCKTGIKKPIPGITPNRIHHYKRLVQNVINGTLDQAFPIAKKVLSKKDWERLCYDFFVNHKCETPQIWKLPLEFYQYVKKENYATKFKKPFLTDLLHFEWLEIEVFTMEDQTFESDYDLFEIEHSKKRPIFNPEYRLIQLSYPVHLSNVTDTLTKKNIYCLLAFRTQKEKRVVFIDIGVFTALFIEYTANNENFSIEQGFNCVCEKLNIKSSESGFKNFLNSLKKLNNKKFLIGLKKNISL